MSKKKQQQPDYYLEMPIPLYEQFSACKNSGDCMMLYFAYYYNAYLISGYKPYDLTIEGTGQLFKWTKKRVQKARRALRKLNVIILADKHLQLNKELFL